MDRRQFLAISTTGITVSIAGCLDDTQDGRQPEEGVEGSQGYDIGLPTVQWEESAVEGDQYRVTVSANLQSEDRIRIEIDGETVATITESGKPVTIAGPNTSYGTVEAWTNITAVYTRDGEERQAGYHIVSTQSESETQSERDQETRPEVSSDPVPTHLGGIVGGTGENLQQGERAERTFEYEIFGGRYEYTSHVPQNLLKHYERRSRLEDYGGYVSDPFHQQYLQDMADAFIEYTDSDMEAIEHARAFVQQLEYTPDRVSQGLDDYAQFPVETLFNRTGDCEDTAILLAALYDQMNYGTILLGMWDAQHMALAIAGEDSIPGTYYEHEGRNYYYVEPTAPGWEIGEMPDSLTQTEAEIFEVNRHPTLVFSWSTEARSGGVDVQMYVTNHGQVMATGVQLVAAFENRSGRTVARDSASVGLVSPDAIEEVSLQLDPPHDEELRGRFSVGMDGVLYDEATTDWIGPSSV